jgi:hypothetical protein
MIIAAAIAAVLTAQAPRDGWTWTLYDHGPDVVLAHEIPDTQHLRATLECEAGSGAATVRIYRFGQPGDFAQLRAGQANAQSAVDADDDGSVGVGLRTDHPAFAAFTTSGRLTVTSGERSSTIVLGRADLAKLRRFGERCAG